MIETCEFGKIVVHGETYTADLIILPDRIEADWWRQKGHRLQVADLGPVFDAQPDVLVVGTGQMGVMRVDPAVQKRLAAEGIELIVGRTPEACKQYNLLASQSRRVAAALHLTC